MTVLGKRSAALAVHGDPAEVITDRARASYR